MASSFEAARRMRAEPAKGMGVSVGRVGRSSIIPNGGVVGSCSLGY